MDMKVKNIILGLLFLSTLVPLTGYGYLNEHTSNKIKIKRASKYKEVAINEDIDTDGVVRKVSWKGPHHPELKNLLGPCFTYYKDYMNQNTRMRFRGSVTIDRDGYHITMGGHMRNVSGEASIDK